MKIRFLPVCVLLALLLMGCMVLSMTACGGNTATPTTAATAAANPARFCFSSIATIIAGSRLPVNGNSTDTSTVNGKSRRVMGYSRNSIP